MPLLANSIPACVVPTPFHDILTLKLHSFARNGLSFAYPVQKASPRGHLKHSSGSPVTCEHWTGEASVKLEGQVTAMLCHHWAPQTRTQAGHLSLLLGTTRFTFLLSKEPPDLFHHQSSNMGYTMQNVSFSQGDQG